jgi:cytochrome c oxidase subunit 3
LTTTNPDLPLNHQPGHIKHDGHNLTGFIIFLCSESIIFLAFFIGFALLKTTAPEWLPEGVEGLETRMPLINTIVLVSSSFVAYFAERYLHQKKTLGLSIFMAPHDGDGSLLRVWTICGMVRTSIRP